MAVSALLEVCFLSSLPPSPPPVQKEEEESVFCMDGVRRIGKQRLCECVGVCALGTSV